MGEQGVAARRGGACWTQPRHRHRSSDSERSGDSGLILYTDPNSERGGGGSVQIRGAPGSMETSTDFFLFSRRRKKQICKLKGEAGMVEDNKDDFWDPEDMVSQEHNAMLNADFSEKEVKDAIFGSYAEDSVEGGRKRGAGGDVEQDGGSSSVAAAAVVAGAWLTPQKRARTTLEVCDINCTRGLGPMLITAEELKRTLEDNELFLAVQSTARKAAETVVLVIDDAGVGTIIPELLRGFNDSQASMRRGSAYLIGFLFKNSKLYLADEAPEMKSTLITLLGDTEKATASVSTRHPTLLL
ncbi:hypothetical protein QYE76_040411 [Lolium multiflorum]|uniref:Stalled ribosome sensor GCN1-like HEAT repeats region domain-containing protein n=1 Tax=Lolium multiflorum TaxID=4521 RepID=A0AAD8WVE8_LOLMU|nr:hypothetical protein QYE76_040411 [Lolium multiflorum]